MSKKKSGKKTSTTTSDTIGPTRLPFDPKATRQATEAHGTLVRPMPIPAETPAQQAERAERTLRIERDALRPNESYAQEIERYPARLARWEARAALCESRKALAAEDDAHVAACVKPVCDDPAHIAFRGVKLWDATHRPSKAELQHLKWCPKEAPGLLTADDDANRLRDAARQQENLDRAQPRAPGEPARPAPFVTPPYADAYCDDPSHLYPPRPIAADVEHCCEFQCYPKWEVNWWLDCVKVSAKTKDRRKAEYASNPTRVRAMLGLKP
jgi:hypothetical protein